MDDYNCGIENFSLIWNPDPRGIETRTRTDLTQILDRHASSQENGYRCPLQPHISNSMRLMDNFNLAIETFLLICNPDSRGIETRNRTDFIHILNRVPTRQLSSERRPLRVAATPPQLDGTEGH